MDATHVYSKTELGAGALSSSRGTVSSSARQFLILVDGRRSLGELAQIFGTDAVERLVPQLEAQGFIRRAHNTVMPDSLTGPRTIIGTSTLGPRTVTGGTTLGPRTVAGLPTLGPRTVTGPTTIDPRTLTGATTTGPRAREAPGAPNARAAGSAPLAQEGPVPRSGVLHIGDALVDAPRERRAGAMEPRDSAVTASAPAAAPRIPIALLTLAVLAASGAIWWFFGPLNSVHAPAAPAAVAVLPSAPTPITVAPPIERPLAAPAPERVPLRPREPPRAAATVVPGATPAGVNANAAAATPTRNNPVAVPAARPAVAPEAATQPSAEAPRTNAPAAVLGATPEAAAPAPASPPPPPPPTPAPAAPVLTPAPPAAKPPAMAPAALAPTVASAAPAEHSSEAAAGPLKILDRKLPKLSRRIRQMGIDHGRLVVKLHVNTGGKVERLELVNANPPEIFDADMRATLQSWVYEPPAAPAVATVELDFAP